MKLVKAAICQNTSECVVYIKSFMIALAVSVLCLHNQVLGYIFCFVRRRHRYFICNFHYCSPNPPLSFAFTCVLSSVNCTTKSDRVFERQWCWTDSHTYSASAFVHTPDISGNETQSKVRYDWVLFREPIKRFAKWVSYQFGVAWCFGDRLGFHFSFRFVVLTTSTCSQQV
jgi:hypothetical protein